MFPAIHEFLGRMKSLFRRQSMDREMTEELEFHQALMRERLEREGRSRAEATAATKRAFGNAGRWQERLREVWQFRALESILRDIKFSTRLLAKSPGFTAIALLTLALGVGANTAVFSLINGLLLRPMPVPDASQLVVLRIEEGGPQPGYAFCTPYFRGLETQHDAFTNVFAYNGDTMQVKGRSGNENIRGALVSGQYFDAMQVAPLLGRYLTPEAEARPVSPLSSARLSGTGGSTVLPMSSVASW